jgi:phosphoribosylformylglycinamidine synthase
VHDVSDGGALVAIAEMALAGGFGADLQSFRSPLVDAFGEDQGRFIVTAAIKIETRHAFYDRARAAGVDATIIGWVKGDRIILRNDQDHEVAEISLSEIRTAHEGFFPKLMSSELTPEF